MPFVELARQRPEAATWAIGASADAPPHIATCKFRRGQNFPRPGEFPRPDMQPNPTISLEQSIRRRLGRRFPLLPGPLSRRQKKWKQHLPWRVWAEIDEEHEASLRAALGIGNESAADQAHREWVLDALARKQLLLRVIPLHPRYRVPPGETRTQRQTRLDRWLPKPFFGDAATMRLGWRTPVRFACPACSQSIRPHNARLLAGPVTFEQVMVVLHTDSCAARWLENGQVWLLYYRCKKDCR